MADLPTPPPPALTQSPSNGVRVVNATPPPPAWFAEYLRERRRALKTELAEVERLLALACAPK